MDILTIKGLRKSFGTKEVLKGIDLSVPQNSVFGFIGKNGAGKTTTMRSVLGLLRTDGGEIHVAGERVTFGKANTNRHIGYLPDVPQFYPFMTASEYMQLCGEALNMSKKEIRVQSDELLSLVGLADEKHYIKGFSRGMKQRLGIAQALLGSPSLLICDEPTSALDPIGRKEILNILSSVKDRTTVLFSSHILSDVERICTDVALIDNGVIVMQGSVNELKNMHSTGEFTLEMFDRSAIDCLCMEFPDSARLVGDTVSFSGGDAEMFRVIEFIKEKGLSIRKLERTEASLESLFMEVIGK